MRIVYHLGAHLTDEERLLRCLLRNRGPLAEQGIIVPGPARYRTLLRDTLATLQGETATPETQALVLEQIMDEDRAERLILSYDNFMAFPQWALRRGLYPNGPERMRAMTRIFPEIQAEFHLALRNPATFLPALLQKQPEKGYDDFIAGIDPLTLRWSDLVRRLRQVNPDVPLTVWCDEDAPLLWPELLRSLSGHAPGTALEGADDFLESLMSADGLQRMRGYLAQNPPASDAVRRRVVSAFLAKFALPERIEMEIDLPGWTEGYVAALDAAYDIDMARIAAMPDVTFLRP
jgi:hypothetical protein